jgi:NAD-dependent SIR2 family protein deacetylase
MLLHAKDSADKIERLKSALMDADSLIIGAGAGLSASAGFEYSGERFRRYFADFEEKYGFHDMYSGSFYPFETPEEQWAFWSRNIYANRYTDAPKPVYDILFDIADGRDYFVITTNVDHCFQKAGFDKQRLFYTQGDYGLWQCSKPCHNQTYDNEETVRAMLERQRDMKIPSELVPRCPKCGEMMTMNLRCDDTFVQDSGWDKAAERYSEFVRAHQNAKVLYLELGVGYNTPGIIKYPFMRMTADNPNAVYACINKGEAYCPKEIRSICIDEDIGEVLAELKEKL